MRNIGILPKARQTGLVIQELQSEVLLYDLENDKALSLNPTSTLIWQHCDGKTSYAELAKKLEERLKTEIGDDFINFALKELNKAKLLNNSSTSNFPNISRRKVLMKYAFPMITMPIVMSLVAPTASAQSSICISPALNDLCDVGQTICCPGLECTLVAGEGICLPAPNAPCNGPGLGSLCDVGQTICCPGLVCRLVAGEGICLPPTS